ncbi:MAG: DUF2723 domain-containing protein [Proteobacteria bacterium]|nr:DUF2723 domain-containing protein [Pseudomonadota bacterium]
MKRVIIFLFLFFFTIYLLSSPPSIVFGDSPELSLASYSLGIAHPPGYPLFSLLTKAFSFLLPLYDYAQKCNIFSAFISSISIILIFTSIFFITKNLIASIIASLYTGFSHIYYQQALIAEVYALNSLILSLLIFCIVKFLGEKDVRWIILAFFLSGLGLGNHHTLLGVFFALLVFSILNKVNVKELAISHLFFLFGLTIYIYLPIRSLTNPILDWGNPENLRNFYGVITREQFGFGGGEYSFVNFLDQATFYLKFINNNLFIPALIIGLFGFIVLLKENKKFCAFLTIIFFVNGTLTLFVLNPEKSEFFLVKEFITPSIIVFSLFIGIGLTYFKKYPKAYPLILILLLTSIIIKFHFQKNELYRKNDRFAYQLAKDTIETLPEKSVIIGEADYSLFPLLYIKNFYYPKKELTILDADFFMLPWYQEQNFEKIPFLKNLMPDLSMHAKSGNLNKKIGIEDLELYKLEQSQKLADNIITNLNRSVYFTHELYEISMLYNHPLKNLLKQYGLAYIYKGDVHRQFDFSLDIFLNEINLSDEELFFLKPYIPYLTDRAYKYYLQNQLINTEKLFSAIYKINPSIENALNYSILLAMNEKTDEAKNFERDLLNSVLKFDPRFALLQGIIKVYDRDYNNAFQLLKIAESNNSSLCEAKLYILKLLIDTNQKEPAMAYFKQIMSVCPENIKLRSEDFIKRAGK